MFLQVGVCGPLQANCYIVATDKGCDCVIIDPGMGAAHFVQPSVEHNGLTPVAVLATHGHFDHVGDAAAVADHYGIPMWIRSEDRPLLPDPESGTGPGMGTWLSRVFPHGVPEPARIESLDGVGRLDVAGLAISVIHAPGHTPGSVLYRIDDDITLVFTGDVVFAGSIGRTDFPCSDPAAMIRTLRGPVLSLPDSAELFSGHGEVTTMADERATNPYLQPRFLDTPSL